MAEPDRVYRFVLLPGRHHLLTRFQAGYLRDLLAGRVTATDGRVPRPKDTAVTGLSLV